MKKNMAIFSKILLLIAIIFLVAMIFRNKTQYAIYNGYFFERPISGQMNISNPDTTKQIVISGGNIRIDGVHMEYKVVEKEERRYDIEVRYEDGEIIFNASNFGVSDVEFYSNTGNVAMAGANQTYEMADSKQEQSESLLTDEETSLRNYLLISAVLVNLRYQLLHGQLAILVCMLIPYIVIGCLLYFKPLPWTHFLNRKLSYWNQVSEFNIRIIGAVMILFSLLLPLALI